MGRTVELEALASVLGQVASGRPRTLFICGPAGIGKTRFVTEALRKFGAPELVQLHGSCIALGGGQVPFLPLREAFGHEPHFKPDWSTEDAGTRIQLFESALGHLESVAEERPVALVIEDLHWSDRSTLDFLAFAIHNLKHGKVLLVATFRTEGMTKMSWLTRWVSDRLRSDDVARIELPALGRDETIDYWTDLSGARPSNDEAESLLARSGGNPLFIEELIRAARRGDTGVPATLKELVAQSFATLSPDALTVLRAAAVVGAVESESLLVEMTELDERQVYAGLRELGEANVLIVDVDAGTYAFRHPLLQESAYEDLLPGERRSYHEVVARALERDGSQEVRHLALIAHHFRRARLVDEAIASALRSAEAEERVHAYAEQAQDLDSVVTLWERSERAAAIAGMSRTELMFKAARAFHLAGYNDVAIDLLERALALVDPNVEPAWAGTLYERLGWYRSLGAFGEQATEAFERALMLIPADPPSIDRARLLGEVAIQRAIWGRTEEAHLTALQALNMARELGAHAEAGRALTALGAALTTSCQYDAAIDTYCTARDILKATGEDEDLARAYTLLGDALHRAERFEEAVNMCLEGFEHTRRAGLVRYHGSLLQASAADMLVRQRRFTEAEAILQEAAGRTDEGLSGIGIRASTAEIAIARGEFDRASQILDPVLERGAEVYPEMHAEVILTRAWLLWWKGNPAGAVAVAMRSLDVVRGTQTPLFAGGAAMWAVRSAADLAEQARARADADGVTRAAALVDDALTKAKLAGWIPTERPTALEQAQRATVAAERARLDQRPDPDAWNVAARRWEAASDPLEQAIARWREAEAVLNSRGAAARARACLEEAALIARDLGAQPLLTRTEDLGRRARIIVGAPEDEAEPPLVKDTIPHGLSLRELEVLARIAEGATNRQIGAALFISPKTVSAHVSHILQKLGASSRVEAAGIAHRLGLRGPSAVNGTEAREGERQETRTGI